MIIQGRRITAFLCALLLALPSFALAQQTPSQQGEKHSLLEEQLIFTPVPPSDPMQQPAFATPAPRPSRPVAPTQKPAARPTPQPTRSSRWTLIVPRATPAPSPSAEPALTLPPIPGSNSLLESAPLLDAEQELFDPELFDAPVPEEAYDKRLYVLDRVKQWQPSEDWSHEMRYGIGGLRIPLLYQYDYRKVVCFYYGRPKSVATSGCGATSMSMVIAYLTGNTEQSPYTLFRWAVNNNMYDGTGLSHEALIAIGEHYGIAGEWIKNDKKALRAALEQGIPVIAHMGRGIFTNQGHYIVLRGITPDGFVLVNDPNSWLHSALPFTLDEIVRQTRTDDPFFLCRRVEHPTVTGE